MLTARDLGRRVVVRRYVGERDGRPRFSDLLGDLVALDEDHLTVRDARGEHRIPREVVVAAKPVPPKRPGVRDVLARERVCAAGWPAAQTEWLGDWLLRASEGWTNRANSVLPLGDPGLPLPEALRTVADWYADRGLHPRFAVPMPGAAGLHHELRARGWQRTHTVLVQTAALPEVRAATARNADTAAPTPTTETTGVAGAEPPTLDAAAEPAQPTAAGGTGTPVVEVGGEPSADWLRIVAGRKGSLPEVAVRVLTGAREPGFATVRRDGELIAIGRGVVDEDWLGLSLVEVVPSMRRQGLARQVVAGLVDWAAQRGARRAYLQVEEDNKAALALYAGFGFTTHHRYHNLTPPAAVN